MSKRREKIEKQVVHVDDLEWEETRRGSRYGWNRKRLGAASGGGRLGCSLMELLPGYRSWPYHFHHGNEEAIYILEGKGTLRLQGRKVPVASGSYVALPPGPDGAHQLHNTSEAPLVYLVFSTMDHPDVVEYPDSGKLGVFAGSAPGTFREEGNGPRFVRTEDTDYWDGEDG